MKSTDGNTAIYDDLAEAFKGLGPTGTACSENILSGLICCAHDRMTEMDPIAMLQSITEG